MYQPKEAMRGRCNPPRTGSPVQKSNLYNIEDTKKMLINLPIPILVKSIEMQLNILSSRGIKIYDFDNKKKVVKQIRIIGNKVYFLAEEDT